MVEPTPEMGPVLQTVFVGLYLVVEFPVTVTGAVPGHVAVMQEETVPL